MFGIIRKLEFTLGFINASNYSSLIQGQGIEDDGI